MLKSIQVIGSGGAFDTYRTNSSFLIKTDTNNLLYDCGYNVFVKLKKLEETDKNIIKTLDTIFISHMDDDHMGSIKSLVYYRYFVYGKTTTIIGLDDVSTYLGDINKEIINHTFVYAPIINFINVNIINFKQKYNIDIEFINGIHHISSFGIILYDTKNLIAISGDTKAQKIFEITINNINAKNLIVFHDYSYWDNPDKNVHACPSDYTTEYSEEFISTTLKYHNDRNTLENMVFTLP